MHHTGHEDKQAHYTKHIHITAISSGQCLHEQMKKAEVLLDDIFMQTVPLGQIRLPTPMQQAIE